MLLKAVLAALVAFAVTAALTTPVAKLAARLGIVDTMKDIGLAREKTPLLGGLAIFAGALVAGLLFLPDNARTQGILAAAALITIVGALDDAFDLPPFVKLAGQAAAAVLLVATGVVVDNFTLPFVHRVDLGDVGAPVTALALVVMMNIVNFSDGVDGLAAGVCAISAAAFSITAFDLERTTAGLLAAIVCGAAIGVLLFNFHPARVFMCDGGSHAVRGARLPALQLPSRARVHGRLRLEPARAAARCGGRRGHLEDERLDRAHRPAGDPRRAVPGHELRRRQADQVPPADLPRRLEPLSPPLPPHRLLAAAHGALPLRLDARDGGQRGRAALHSLQREVRAPERRLGRVDGCAAVRGRRRQRVPGLHPRDPQVPPPALMAAAPERARNLRARDRRPGRARARDGRVPILGVRRETRTRLCG